MDIVIFSSAETSYFIEFETRLMSILIGENPLNISFNSSSSIAILFNTSPSKSALQWTISLETGGSSDSPIFYLPFPFKGAHPHHLCGRTLLASSCVFIHIMLSIVSELISCGWLVHLTGFEPVTPGLKVRCSTY